MRILGIDYGDARTGLSISDPSGFLAGSPSVIHEWHYAKLVDERRTTVAAHEILHRSGKKEKKHRQSVDAVAATLILQGYLDFKRRQ